MPNRSENDYNELLSPDNDDTKSIASNSNLSNSDPKEDQKRTTNEQDDINFWLPASSNVIAPVTAEKTSDAVEEKKEKKKSKKSKSSEKDKENETTENETASSSKHKEKEAKKEKKSKTHDKKPEGKDINNQDINLKTNGHQNSPKHYNNQLDVEYRSLASSKHLKIVRFHFYF